MQLNCIKIRNFCATRNTLKKMKTHREKIFAKHISDKGFIFKTYKELLISAIKGQFNLKSKLRTRIDSFPKERNVTSTL